MPTKYDLTHQGKTYELTWDKDVPPTEADIQQILSSLGGAPDEKSVMGFAGNVLKGVAKLPVQAAEVAGALGGTVVKGYSDLYQDPVGAISRTLKGVTQIPAMAAEVATQAPGAIASYAQKYSPSNLGNTLYEDPVGAAMDASMVLRPIGALTKIGAVSKTAAALDPFEGMARGVSHVVGPRLEARAEKWMKSALRVPNKIEDRNPNVNFAREALHLQSPSRRDPRDMIRGLHVSRPGEENLERGINALEQQRRAVVTQSPATTRLTETTLPELGKEVKESDRLSAAIRMGGEDPTTAARLRKDFLHDPNIATPVTDVEGNIIDYTPKDVGVKLVDDMKIRLGRSLSNQFGKDVTSVMTDAQQAARHDLKTLVEQMTPEIGPINQSLSTRYALQDAIQNRLRNWERQSIFGMRHNIGANVAGGTLSRIPLRMMGAMVAGMADNPEMLSGAAIQLSKAADRLQRMVPAAKYQTAAVVLDKLLSGQATPQAVGQATKTFMGLMESDPTYARLSPQQREDQRQQLMMDLSVMAGAPLPSHTQKKSFGLQQEQALADARTTERP